MTRYFWIYHGFLTITEKVLRRKGKKPSTQENVDASMLKGPLRNNLKKLKNLKFLVIGN